ncbi:citrinin polyketide synthase [Hypoxylon trugodes]|uniref:citrinin polyketide synthase n=1 Tax=Hypoxylon trugodes TaxID=326681 RepID=UPI0021902197|nr:citrinin polyketide synthase [Hypoxylon trugodes]KAI1394380.1 citrinin polyketide synthase [Hypoxylon trugodes]
MIAYSSGPKPARKVLLFGPQALAFDISFFNKLYNQLHEAPGNHWALDSVSTLPGFWKDLLKNIPKLQHLDGEQLLRDLNEGLKIGDISPSLFPLPNILLSPLVIIAQLTQYLSFLKAALPDLADNDELPASVTENTETLGLCTGMLSALAVGCSSSVAELRSYGAVAVRLAMLVGALVDAEELSPDSGGKSVSFSVSWNGAESSAAVNQVLEKFPEAYVSVFVDERRSTVTASRRIAPALIENLKKCGVYVTEVALYGRFHWVKHQENVDKLIQLCDQTPELQFPSPSKMVLSSRLETGGQYISTGSLHESALREILLKPSQWLSTFSLLYTSQLITDGNVICFGPERCVPPTIARKLGSRLVHISDVDLTTSPVPGTLLGRSSAPALEDLPDERIAVIGMSCHVPGAQDLDEFWNILVKAESQHREVPTDRFSMETPWRELEPNRKWFGNFMQDYDTFDHKFFKKSPREMSSTDPQHRLCLKLAYQAVEQAGYFAVPDIDKQIGVYIGVGNNDYERNIACYPPNAYSATGNLRSFIAGKVSHYFGWTGPALTIDTACSSSAVAIHQACRSIITGECSTAVAGGVNVLTSPEWFQNLSGASFLSPTGQCKPFDVKADGYCRGEGGGIVFLKKLSSAIADGDQVLGVIAGTRVYQNQNCTAITVPNAISLSDLFTDVVRQSRLEPHAVSVVEAHGTGTPVGDPAEYDGIRQILGGPKRPNTLSLSSVKGLLGHTEFSSGVIALLKILLMINEGSIPPQASFTTINPAIKAVPEDKIEIPTRLKSWDVGFRAALINNYGASGSNASMVITESPKLLTGKPLPGPSSAENFPFWFCGFDQSSLRSYVAKFRRLLQVQSSSRKDLSVRNLSFQLSRQSNRTLPQALILNAKSTSDLDQKLEAFEKGDNSVAAIPLQPVRPVILCFGGQISTFVGLDKDVYDRVTLLRAHLDQCDAMCLSLGLDSIYPGIFQKSPIEDTVKLQTILFATQYSCAKSWIDSGVKVTAVVGHSFGELTALCVAGAYSLKDAFKLISGRARLIRDTWGTDKGSMLAVEADITDVEALISASNKASGGASPLSIACYNGPKTFTLGGSAKAAQIAEDLVKNDPAFSRFKLKKLNVTNAFHTALVDALKDDLEVLGRGIAVSEPAIKVERATEQRSAGKLESSFVAKHMRNPVFFNHAVQRLAKEYPAAIWLEAGSNSTVTNMASRALGNPSTGHFQPANVTSDNSFQFLADATTKLWKQGLNVSFWAHHKSQVSEYSPIVLPPYQFEKTRHWMELKAPPKLEVPVVEQVQVPEVPKGLTTFVGYQDDAKRSVRFRVNTSIDKFQKPTSANIVVNAAVCTPGTLQLEVVLDAFLNLRSNFKDFSFQPEIRGLVYHNALIADPSKTLFVDAVAKDGEGLIWDWKLSGTNSSGSVTDYSSATIVFRAANDPQLNEYFESLARLSGRKRCADLLRGDLADDVLQGRNIYRAFEQVVDYKEHLRHVTKIAGKDLDAAGRVTKAYEGENWIDPVLTECFCQVTGIFVNLMTDASDLSKRGIFISERIARWIRNPKLSGTGSQSDVWEVFAVHHRESETKYISDVFAFDARDGSLVEAVLGISYVKVPLEGFRRILSRGAQSASQPPTTAATSAPSQVQAPEPVAAAPTATSAAPSQPKAAAKKAPKAAGPDIAGKTRDIVCNLSGLEPSEVQDDSDLIEIGIDSLMAMELVREVEAAFKCTLSNDQLMDLTHFRSLVVCIRSTLGLPDEGADEDEEESSTGETEAAPQTNGVAHTNGVNGVNETNGVNGAHVTNGVNGVNGANGLHDTNGVNGKEELNGINGVNGHVPSSGKDIDLPTSTTLNVFREVKWTTDDFIAQEKLANYHKKVVPRSTELCAAYLVQAFEQLGCPIRSAKPGQRLERVPYHPKHERNMKLMYQILEVDARLIDINGSEITRTAVAAPTKSPEALLEKLLHDEPASAAEHRLTAITGGSLSDIITGKVDAAQLIFGTPESREVASAFYANSPFTGVWIQQLEHFLKQFVAALPKNGDTLRIFEVGGGTGGTTCKLVPLLARLGVPVKYTMTDISGSLIAAARKRFKQYPFMEFKMFDMESEPDSKFLESQHIVLGTNCIHATRDLSISLTNLRRVLRPDGFLILLEMTEMVPWVDFVFGMIEGWWLFEDGRDYVLQPPTHWEKVLHSVGYGHVDWTDGDLPEAGLQRLIIAHASGPKFERGPKPPAPPAVEEAPAIPDQTERRAMIEAYIDKYIKDFRAPSNSGGPTTTSTPAGKRVLVTGATGSLGAHIAASLARRPDVEMVVCINRISTIEAKTRQKKSLEMRGIMLDEESLAKLNVVETDTSKPNLGFSPETYDYMVHNVTQIVHSAWPMSLTRPIRTYEIQFKIVRNLIDLACRISEYRPPPFRVGFQFVSSIATVANYPQWKGVPRVPEGLTQMESVPYTGYAEAKMGSEHMLHRTLYSLPERFHTMAVRVAQIAGSTSNGYWNPTEYIPFLVKTSQNLKLLPDLDGDLSWYPVDDVASTLGDLLVSGTAEDMVYHIDNPSRQTWKELIANLASVLGLGPESIVPFDEWIDRVRRFRASTTDNPSLQLMDFFEIYFVPMSCGGLILDTTQAEKHSETLKNEGPIDYNLLMKYIESWKRSGFLNP